MGGEIISTVAITKRNIAPNTITQRTFHRTFTCYNIHIRKYGAVEFEVHWLLQQQSRGYKLQQNLQRKQRRGTQEQK